jgi:Flp pilus assembly protein protease CpaA
MMLNVVVTLFLMACLVGDLGDGRIPNVLILAFLLPVMIRVAFLGMPPGFLELGIPIVLLLFVTWFLGLLGGGDVKVFLTLSLLLSGVMLLHLLCLTLTLSLITFLGRSLWRRSWVRTMPMMPFVVVAFLVIWL